MCERRPKTTVAKRLRKLSVGVIAALIGTGADYQRMKTFWIARCLYAETTAVL